MPTLYIPSLWYKGARIQPWDFCWLHRFQSYVENLGVYFYYVKIPIQQMLHVTLTVGHKFVNDLKNWFSLLWS